MAVRLASDTIRTLYAIQCATKDVKHQPPYCKNRFQEMCRAGQFRHVSKNSTDSMPYAVSSAGKAKHTQKQRSSISSDNALVHKVHPNDRPLRNDVQERAKCTELDDILAKWNVYKPKK